jgi:predicted metal-dependent peptidase
MDYKARDKVSEAIWKFFNNYRFYYYMLSSMARIEDSKNCPSMGVGFIRGSIPTLFYNPEWVSKRSDAEMMAVLNHECQHIGLQHLHRLGQRDRKISNLAMDVIVNSNIPQLDELPEFRKMIVTADKFKELDGKNVRDMTWENIYDLIKPEIDKKQKEFQDMIDDALKNHDKWDNSGGEQGEPNEECQECGGSGKGEDGEKCEKCDGTGKQVPGQEMTPEQEAAVKGLLSEASKKLGSHSPGNVPGAISRLIEKLQKVRFNWKQQLSLFSQTCAKEEVCSTWKKPSRRFGVFSPGKRKDFRPRLLGIVDNSGSVDKSTYEAFISHMCKIADLCEDLDGVGVDTRVNFEFKFKRGETPKHEDRISGGGTSFQPGFDYAKGKGYDGIIYFTDGYASHDMDTYRIPTLFAICPHGVEVKGQRNIKIDTEDEF